MDHSLIAFALVAEEYERSGDPVKGLAPLFKAVLSSQAGQIFNPAAFASAFSERYGFYMPAHVARGLAVRLVELHILSEVSRDQFQVSEDLKSFQAKFGEERLKATVDLFAEWAQGEIDNLGIQLGSSNLQDALLTRLARPEFASVFTSQAEPRTAERVKGLLGRAAVSKKVDEKAVLDYLVARFLLRAKDDAPEVFDELSAIAFGAVIADAVAGLSVPGIAKMPEPPLRVVIDGPLLLDYLNLNTDEHREYAEGLFRLMRDANLMLATFDHVIDEVRNTIKASLREFKGGKEYGPLGERLRKTPAFATYATHVLDTLEQRLEREGVVILRFEVYERQDLKNFFNDDRVDSLRNALGDVHLNLDRRIRDANSVAGVVRLKKNNRRASSIFQAGTTFLTRNSALYSRVQHALSVGKEEPDPRFAVVTDSQLCGVLWFSFGSTGQVELTKRRLVANCAAAVLPQREVVQRITKFLENLDVELAEEFTVLMRDERASLCPMRLTAGQVDLVTQESAKRTLELMREELAAPVVERASLVQLAAERERQVLLAEIQQGKDTVAVMQGVVEKTSSSFNEELAQLSLRLEMEKSTLFQVRKVIATRIEDLRKKATELNGRARVVARRIELSLHGVSLLLITGTAIWALFAEGDGVKKVLVPVVFVQIVSYAFIFSRVEKAFIKMGDRYVARLRSQASALEAEAAQLSLQLLDRSSEREDPRIVA